MQGSELSERHLQSSTAALPSNKSVSQRRFSSVPVGGSLKRGFDLVFSIVLVVILAPLLALIYVSIRLSDGGPALFCQTRVGFGGHPFRVFKFRSMVLDAERRLNDILKNDPEAAREWESSQKLRMDPRVTWLGRTLRRTSLDELPQLLNVLRGEMSLVGPRPIDPSELERRYEGRVSPFNLARPGITGLWQVSGRSECTYEERMVLERRYIDTWSFTRDIKIIGLTIAELLKQRGAY